MTQHVKLRKDREEQIYFSENADTNAQVQMVVNTNSLTIFLDLTLAEAKGFRAALERSIAQYQRRQKRLDAMFQKSTKKKAKPEKQMGQGVKADEYSDGDT